MTGGSKGAGLAGHARSAREPRPPREHAVQVSARAAAAILGPSRDGHAALGAVIPSLARTTPASANSPPCPRVASRHPRPWQGARLAGSRHRESREQRGLGRCQGPLG